MADLKILINSQFNGKGLQDAEKSLKNLGPAARTADEGLTKVGKSSGLISGALGNLAAGGVVLGAGAALLAFGKKAITAASDVEEMESKFNIVFANVGSTVTKQLDAFGQATGRSTNELKGMAAGLGDLFQPLGFSEEKAGELSVQMVKLATDLSSFNNMPMDEALQRLQGTLIGSHENALAFGVVINENTLKAEMAANGWDKLTGAALENAKVQARLNLIMAGTTAAQGDATRTADGFANQMRALESAVGELAVVLGQSLLPAATEVVSTLAKLTRESVNTVQQTKSFVDVVKLLPAAISEGRISMMDAAKVMAVYQAGGQLSEEALIKLGIVVDNLTPKLNLNRAATEGSADAYLKYAEAARGAEKAAAPFGETLRNVERVLLQHGGSLRDTSQQMEEAAYASGELGNAQERLQGYIEADAKAMEEEARAAEALAQKQKELAAASGKYFSAAMDMARGERIVADALGTTRTVMIEVGGRTEEQSEEMERLQGIYDKSAQTIADYRSGLKGVGLEEDALNKKIEEQTLIMNNAAAAMAPLQGIASEMSASTYTASINQDALNQSLFEQAAAAGASAEQLAGLGLARGLLTEAEANALLQEAALRIKIEELAQGYADGRLTIDQVNSSLTTFQNQMLGIVEPTSNATEAIRDVKEEAQEFAGNSPYAATVEVDTSAAEQKINSLREALESLSFIGGIFGGPDGAKGGTKAGGGPVAAGMPYIVGERGPELFVPRSSGTVVPNNQLIGGGSTSITVNVYGGGEGVGVKARDGVLDAARQIGLKVF